MPVGLILSGMPNLLEMLNVDRQLARRVVPIAFPRLTVSADMTQVQYMIAHYVQKAGLTAASELMSNDFVARLIHAADGEFGLVIELTINAIEGGLIGNAQSLGIADFASMFHRRSGCIPGLNPFVIADFERIDTRRLLGQESSK